MTHKIQKNYFYRLFLTGATLLLSACQPNFGFQLNLSSLLTQLAPPAEEPTPLPKVRILFVIDNSPGMSNHQETLVKGFEEFSHLVFHDQLDLAVATITTDTYLAGYGVYHLGPMNGVCYGRLLPGFHDGERGIFSSFALSESFLPHSCELTAESKAALKESGKRSLRPILSTLPPDGSKPDADYFDSLRADFRLNAKPGIQGHTDPRGFQSLHQFLLLNEERPECANVLEKDPSCFFPHYDPKEVAAQPLYIVVTVSDQHDFSQTNFGYFGHSRVGHSPAALKTLSPEKIQQSSHQLAKAMKRRLDDFFLSLQDSRTNNPNYQFFSIAKTDCTESTDEKCGIEYSKLIDLYADDPANPRRVESKIFNIESNSYREFFDQIRNQIELTYDLPQKKL